MPNRKQSTRLLQRGIFYLSISHVHTFTQSLTLRLETESILR